LAHGGASHEGFIEKRRLFPFVATIPAHQRILRECRILREKTDVSLRLNFEQRVADVSVDHPAVVQNYRIAHEIAVRHEREDVGIEKLREAMIHYRALFADLLHDVKETVLARLEPSQRRNLAAALWPEDGASTGDGGAGAVAAA